MAEEKLGLRGAIGRRTSRMAGVMGEIRKTRVPAQKKVIKKKAAQWAGRTKSAYSN
jgi:hypothetical protein